ILPTSIEGPTMIQRQLRRRGFALLVVLAMTGTLTSYRASQGQGPSAPQEDPCTPLLKAALRDDGTGSASILWDINQALRRCLYEKLPSLDRRIPPAALSEQIKTLNALLGALAKADARVNALGKGLGDDTLLYEAERNRAAAWLHAWATFSRLVQEA